MRRRPLLLIVEDDRVLRELYRVALSEELRAHAATQDVPIVVVTGMEPAPHLPGATLLRKPVSPEQLTAAVERALIAEGYDRRATRRGWPPDRRRTRLDPIL